MNRPDDALISQLVHSEFMHLPLSVPSVELQGVTAHVRGPYGPDPKPYATDMHAAFDVLLELSDRLRQAGRSPQMHIDFDRGPDGGCIYRLRGDGFEGSWTDSEPRAICLGSLRYAGVTIE